MTDYIPERKQYYVVLRGAFNPLMFQPEWFGRNDVIAHEEVTYARNQSNAQPTIVTPQLTLFRTTQFIVTVDSATFQVVAQKEPLVTLKDFVRKTFEKLGGITIGAYGLNFSAHYKFANEELINTFADRLAPKQYWRSLLGDDINSKNRKGGLTSIQMHKFKDNNEGNISILLEQSAHVRPGIWLACNDHVNVNENDSEAEIAIEKLASTFDGSFECMKKIQLDLIMETMKDE